MSPTSTGNVLLRELGCAACHGASNEFPPAPAPDLAGLSTRASATWVQDYLMDPGGVRHGARMPRTITGAKREQVARELTHYLFGRDVDNDTRSIGDGGDATSGGALFHSTGCVACHDPREGAYPGEAAPELDGAVSLDHVEAKFTRASLGAFLFDPLEARPAGRMPDMKLTRAEARDLAAFLMPNARGEKDLRIDDELATRGKEHYERFGCVSCHEAASGHRPAMPFEQLDTTKGCLDPADESTPRYGLSTQQRDAIVAALGTRTAPAPAVLVEEKLTALNCTACHVRGEYGGVLPELDPYFHSSEHDLGDSARIPPELTDVGAKLQDEWLRKVLFDGLEVRSYMHTRMPRFAPDALEDLPDLFAQVDEVEPYELTKPKRGDEDRAWRDGARELLGTKGLGCVQCHDFNGKPSPGFGGMDLITTYDRLHPDWFAQFLIAPQKYRPNIVMPESWADGIASHSRILEGDTHKQLSAIWHYLSLGTSAGDPPGIQRVSTNLVVEDEVRTYRGRSRIAGFRGFTVGFPGGLCYAFDLQNGALAAVWKGDWVSVYWGGQGAGDFNPRSRAIEVGRDVAFYRLADADEPWPLMPFMDKENPVNPDPFYPKNKGYEFRGYSFDEAFVPTLEYWTGDVQVLDRTTAVAGEENKLRRDLLLSTVTDQQLWFRVVAGDWEERGEQVKIGKLLITPPPGERLVREFQRQATKPEDVKTHRELLVRLDVSAGENPITIDYEVLP